MFAAHCYCQRCRDPAGHHPAHSGGCVPSELPWASSHTSLTLSSSAPGTGIRRQPGSWLCRFSGRARGSEHGANARAGGCGRRRGMLWRESAGPVTGASLGTGASGRLWG